jgi:proteasome lid subunit RPN8/RPN11
VTPIYVKTSHAMAWPTDRVFYLLAGDGLYLCRNGDYWCSSVPAPGWPTELAEHATWLRPDYPRIPRSVIERICGFFGLISATHAAEAIALLAWDREAERVRAIVPRQVAVVRRNRDGSAHPVGVRYEFPHNLPDRLSLFGDIHSHSHLDPYASLVDVEDEVGPGGLHIVVGRLQQEPPEFSVQAAVDGTRFEIRPERVIPAYEGRRTDFPSVWIDRVEITDEEGGWNSVSDSDRTSEYDG